MSIGNTTENNWLNLFYRAVAIANYADNAASSPEANISCALHTADPGDTGTMSTSEISYTSYARKNVARTTGGWSAASGGSISPAASIDFDASTGGTGGTVTHLSTGKTGGGASDILMSGTATPNQLVASGVQVKASTATTVSLD